MQKLVNWLLARRAAIVAVAVVFAPTITFISAGVIAVQWAWRGAAVAIGDALLACLAVSVLAMAAVGPGGAMPLALSWCLPIASGCLLGGILRRTGSLKLSMQILLLLGFFGVGLYSVFGPMPGALSDEEMRQLIEAPGLAGVPGDPAAAINALRPRLVGFFGLQICLELILALFLAAWLLGFVRDKKEFASQYRSLTIGYVLGVPFALIIVLALVSDYGLLHNLFGIAGLAWLLRGLVFFHRRVHDMGAHPIVYVPVYIFGVLFGFSLLIQGIFSDGLIDWD